MPRANTTASAGRQAPVQLDQQIHPVADDFAHPAHVVDGIAHLLDVGLEVDLVVAFVEERIQVAECVEARLHLRLALHQDLLDGVLVDMPVDARLLAHRPAEQFVDRHLQRAALDVPQRDVDGGNRRVDRQPLKVAEAVHDVPVMLDLERALADEILGEPPDRGTRRLDVTPRARFPVAGDALVGIDAHEHELADVQRLDFRDFH